MCEDVRRSTALVLSLAGSKSCVQIDDAQLAAELDAHPELYAPREPPSWHAPFHYSDGTDLTAQYVLVLDALNFCFWPLPGYEYEHLAGSLKAVLERDKSAFDAEKLAGITAAQLNSWLNTVRPKGEGKEELRIPLVEERARLLREVGSVLLKQFGGSAANLVRAAKHSAAALVDLVTAHLPGFRDSTVYKGHQVFLYKRAQIFVGDIFGAFKGEGLGRFDDIGALTCFPDYRLPQLLRQIGIFKFAPATERKVDSLEEIPAGSEEEVEIRAATVQVVERMARYLNDKLAKAGDSRRVFPVHIDWMLWTRGEALLPSLKPHHRTLTIFY